MNQLFYRYYLGTHERSPGQRHLYVVQDPDTDAPLHMEPQCLTCNLHQYLGSKGRATYINCTYFTAYVSPLAPDGRLTKLMTLVIQIIQEVFTNGWCVIE